MSKLSDVSNAAIRELLGCYSTGKAVPASAVGAATFKTTQSPAGTLQAVINGEPNAILANLTTTAMLALPALQNPITGLDDFYVQPGSGTAGGPGVVTTVYYLIVVNAANTVYVIQGNYTGRPYTPFKGGNVLGVSEIPDIAVKELYAPIGAIKVVTGTSAFTPKTTFLDATTGGMVITFASINRLGNALPTFA